MAEFTPVTLTHKDGRERVATTPREQVEAEFAGFAVRTAGQKAAATRARKAASKKAAPAKRTTAKKTAAKATASPTEAAKGAPPADNASAAPVTV